MKTKYLALKILAYCIATTALGQAQPDAAPATLLAQRYDAAFPISPQLYNGPEYIDYSKRFSKIIGNQFFLSAEKKPGSVYYNNHLFTNVSLAYDVVEDQVVLQHPSNPLELRLVNEKVRSFSIADHKFVRVVADSASQVVSTGYYEVLTDTEPVLLARRRKTVHRQASQGGIVGEFLERDALFIRKNNAYYPADSKRMVTRLFSDHAKDIQAYIHDHKLKFRRKTREADTAQLIRYYSTLPPQ